MAEKKAVSETKALPTVKVGGVEYPLHIDKLSDMRFIVMMGDLNDPTMGDEEKLAVQSKMLRFVFGDGRFDVLDSIAEANGGSVTSEAFAAWWIDYLMAANAKN